MAKETNTVAPFQVNVKRHPEKNWKVATYNFSDVNGYHWSKISGGNNQGTINWTLFAYVICNKMLSGQIDHSGIHGSCPHNIKVAITKKNNPKSYNYLANLAGPKPANTNRIALTKAEKANIIYLMWTAKTAASAYNDTGLSGNPDLVYDNTGNASFIKRCKQRNLSWGLLSPEGGVWLPDDIKTHDAKRLNELTNDEIQRLSDDIKNRLSSYPGGVGVYSAKAFDRTQLHEQIIASSGIKFLMLHTIKDIGVK